LIYVALPIHNERHTAGVLMWRLREIFAELGRDFRIVAVDDASTDGLEEVLAPYERVMPLTVLRNDTRLGYGASLERAIREAVRASRYPKRDALLVMQADFTDDPASVADLLRRYQGGADLVIGTCSDLRAAPRGLRAARFGARVLARPSGVPEGVSDPWSGFRMYRLMVLRRAIASLPQGESLIRRDGWAANVDLLQRVAPHVRQWDEIDVPFNLSRRYRESRFRALPQLRGLLRST
jgi:glycosyltransferase involved in cell wall biosynthesis